MSAADSRYGWLVVAVAVAAIFMMWGMLFTFTVYSRALMAAFDVSRVAASSLFSVGVLCFFFLGGGVNLFTARLPVRRVVASAFGLVVASLALFQAVTSLVGLAAVFAGLGAAFGTVYVAILALVPQWFDRHEGLAMGVALSGNGVGVFVMPLVWLRLIDPLGFRTTFTLVGTAVALLFGVAAVVFQRPAHAAGGERDLRDELNWLVELLRDRRPWYAVVGIGLVFAWYFVLSDQLVDMLVAADLRMGVAAAAFGFIGGVAVVSRVVSGAIADRLTLRGTFAGAGALVTVGLVLLLFRANLVATYLAIALLGIGYGGIPALYVPIALRAFGTSHANAVTGLLILAQGVFGFVAPPLASLTATSSGYGPVLAGLAVVTAIGTLAFWRGTPDASVRHQPA